MLLRLLCFLYVSILFTSCCTTTHSIGEKFGGGIVFYTDDKGCHGLIAATEDQGTALPWYNGVTKVTGADKRKPGSGASNTRRIVARQSQDSGDGNYAAKVCADYKITVDDKTFDDWYLPSIDELGLLFKERDRVGIIMNVQWPPDFWSSTETAFNTAVSQDFFFGSLLESAAKGNQNRVRAIRSF
jgi:hypothetical protein